MSFHTRHSQLSSKLCELALRDADDADDGVGVVDAPTASASSAALDLAFRSALDTLLSAAQRGEVDSARCVRAATRLIDVSLDVVARTCVDAGDVRRQLPVALLHDLLESLALDDCTLAFDFLERRADTLARVCMPRAKNVLLRTCNELLARVSHLHAPALCGRILVFLARFYPLSDKSGVNLRGEIASAPGTAIDVDSEETFAAAVDKLAAASDRPPSPSSSSSSSSPSSSSRPDFSFYSVFWSMQRLLRDPARIAAREVWPSFLADLDSVLCVFEAQPLPPDARDNVLSSSSSSSGGGDPPHADAETSSTRYLTSSRLIQLQLADPTFRRQILTQLFSFFHMLANSINKSPPSAATAAAASSSSSSVAAKKSSSSSSSSAAAASSSSSSSSSSANSNAASAASASSATTGLVLTKLSQRDATSQLLERISALLRATPPDGDEYVDALARVLEREQWWIEWKRRACYDFARPTLAELLSRAPRVPTRLSLPRAGADSDAFRARQLDSTLLDARGRARQPRLESALEHVREQADPDNMIDAEYRDVRNKTFQWRLLRLVHTEDMRRLFDIKLPSRTNIVAPPPSSGAKSSSSHRGFEFDFEKLFSDELTKKIADARAAAAAAAAADALAAAEAEAKAEANDDGDGDGDGDNDNDANANANANADEMDDDDGGKAKKKQVTTSGKKRARDADNADADADADANTGDSETSKRVKTE